MRASFVGTCAVVLQAMIAAGPAGIADVSAQEAASVPDGPRFLLAVAGRAKPVETEVSAVPLLRRRIALTLEDQSIADALRAIGAETGIEFVYRTEMPTLGKRVTLRAENITVGAALTDILVDAKVDVLLSGGRYVTLVPREGVAVAATGSIAGRVTDAKTQTALAGATVLVLGTNRSGTTGNDGRYRLADVAPGTYTVRARYIGYVPGTASVAVSANEEATADFALEKSVQRLDEVVTTGTIVETQEKALPNPITVITADEIREKGVTRVDQLFRGDVPGVFASEQGSSDEVSRIFVRGGSDLFASGGIKTYVDGVEINSGSNFLSTIDPNMIERIEVIRGPQASTIYGSEALNGVLQIFTKHGTATSRPVVTGQLATGAIQTQWLSKDAAPTYRGNLNISGGTGSFSYNVGGGRLYKGEWFPEYHDGENSLYASFRGSQGWFSAEVSGRVEYQQRGEPHSAITRFFPDVPALAAPLLEDANYQSTGFAVTLRARATAHWQHTLTVGTDRLLQEFIQRAPRLTSPDDTLLSTTSSQGHRLTLLYTSTLEGALTHSLQGSLTAGVNVTSYKAADFGGTFPQNSGALAPGGVEFVSRIVASDRGYFAQGQLGIADALFVTAGLRAEGNDNYGQNYGLAWAPRVGVSYVRSLGAVTLKVRSSYGKSIRAPFDYERNGSADANGIVLPSPNLGPESQRGWDAGAELYAGNAVTLQATYYDQTADGLIDLVNLTPGVFVTSQYQNLGVVKNRGVELQGSISPIPWATLSGSFAVTNSHVQRLSPDYTGDLRVDDQLLNVAKYNAGANLRVGGGAWIGNVGMVYHGSWTMYDYVPLYACFYRGICPGTGFRTFFTTYPSFTKFRLALSRQVGRAVTAFATVENLANSYAFEESNYVASPGRTTTAGVNFRF